MLILNSEKCAPNMNSMNTKNILPKGKSYRWERMFFDRTFEGVTQKFSFSENP